MTSQQETEQQIPEDHVRHVCRSYPVCAFLFYSEDYSHEICKKRGTEQTLLDHLLSQITKGEKSDRCSGPSEFNQIITPETKTS